MKRYRSHSRTATCAFLIAIALLFSAALLPAQQRGPREGSRGEDSGGRELGAQEQEQEQEREREHQTESTQARNQDREQEQEREPSAEPEREREQARDQVHDQAREPQAQADVEPERDRDRDRARETLQDQDRMREQDRQMVQDMDREMFQEYAQMRVSDLMDEHRQLTERITDRLGAATPEQMSELAELESRRVQVRAEILNLDEASDWEQQRDQIMEELAQIRSRYQEMEREVEE